MTVKRQPQIGVRVVGRGAITPVGTGIQESFENLLAGQSGLTEVPESHASQFNSKYCYQIPGGLESSERGRAGRWVCEAIEQALAEAGLEGLPDNVPVIIGTGLGEARTAELAWLDREAVGGEALTINAAVRDRFGATEVNTISNACAASLYATAMALDLLNSGAVEQVVVAGVDLISASMFGLLDRVHPVASERVAPFDRDRAGVLMGEGAVAVVLSRVATQGPLIHAVALGCDAAHVTAPDAASIEECMRHAHSEAKVESTQIGLVLAHGTGTVLNDRTEAVAMSAIWSGLTSPPVAALKGATGHMSGASGLFSLLIAASCLERGLVPPILYLQNPDEAATGLDLVSAPRVLRGQSIAQVNAFGFGGLNAVAIISVENEVTS